MSDQHSSHHRYAKQQHIQNRGQSSFNISRVMLIVMTVMFTASMVLDYPNWQIASILNQYDNGDQDAAIGRLKEFVKKHPRRSPAKMLLIDKMINNGHAKEALDLIDSVDSGGSYTTIKRIEALQKLGRFKEALEAFKEHGRYESLNPDDRTMRINALAYFRALAEVELEKAARNINQIVRDINRQQNQLTKTELSTSVKMRIWSAMLFDECGEPERGVELLNPLVEEYFKQWSELQKGNDSNAAEPGGLFKMLVQQIGQLVTDQHARKLEFFKSELAWIVTARAYLLEKSGNAPAAAKDQEFVYSLELDPTSILAKIPKPNECFKDLRLLAMFVDTQALVMDKRQENRLAIAQFNNVVIAGEALLCASQALSITESPINIMADQRNRAVHLGLYKYSLAVYLNHRHDVYREVGLFEAAKKDAARIKQLGFEPGIELN